MNSRRFWLLSIPTVLIGGLLLILLFNTLKREGLFSKPQGPATALTAFANYSPVEIDGAVYFPTVSATGHSYELAARSQALAGTPVLLTVWSALDFNGCGTSVAAFKADINQLMDELGGGYQLTEVDLSGFAPLP